ncbi:MAG: hypothetical protein ACQET5_06220 [Halobacteriota archaeon]|uniref:hypothetical protein n=1 Tax=Natronomonas sp. TaxID=2184060 RepID=UPI003976D7F7
MLWNVLAVVYGAFVALFPERTLEYLTRIVLVGYENPEELEPSEWYVSLTRIDGLLLAAAGLLAIAFERGCSKRQRTSDDDTER